jgi:hypothetical protein
VLQQLKGTTMKNSDICDFLSDKERRSCLELFCIKNSCSTNRWNNPETIVEWKRQEASGQSIDIIFSKGRSIFLTPPPELLTKEIEDVTSRLSCLTDIAVRAGLLETGTPEITDPTDKSDTAKTVKTFKETFERLKMELSQKRDELRDLFSEMQDLAECNDRAVDAMKEAGDALSELL